MDGKYLKWRKKIENLTRIIVWKRRLATFRDAGLFSFSQSYISFKEYILITALAIDINGLWKLELVL